VVGVSDELVEWLLVRIAEDERVVRYASVNAHWPSLHLDGNGYCVMDLRRVLAECDAKREIVKLHEPMSVQPGSEWFNDAHLTDEPMRLCRSCEPEKMFRRQSSYPCRTIRVLALPYADHEGYRQEWRP
jgi:hypothetical protein